LPDKYWLALKENEVIGTVGLLFIQPQNAILKSMMVRKDFRGRMHGLSRLLLQKAMDCCLEKEIEEIYLGTMAQFKAAQKFYQKNGFKRILGMVNK
jgi:N-acetylglutamate synthase-like GNAT family acetyltransferase